MHLGGLLFHCLFFHGRPARRSPVSPSVRVDFTCKNTRSVRHLYDLSCTKCNSCCAFCLFAGRSLEKSPNFSSKVPHLLHKVPRFFPFPRPFSPYVSAVFSEKAETLTEIIPTRSRAHAKSAEVPAGFSKNLRTSCLQHVICQNTDRRSFNAQLVVYRRRVAAFVVHSGR